VGFPRIKKEIIKMKTITYHDVSERHIWELKCPYCEEWQEFEDEPFEDDIICCPSCSEEILVKE